MDEAHVLKDKGSFRWKNLMAVAQHARQRLMLTGTPLQNDLHVSRFDKAQTDGSHSTYMLLCFSKGVSRKTSSYDEIDVQNFLKNVDYSTR